jgi:hypothetical protein
MSSKSSMQKSLSKSVMRKNQKNASRVDAVIQGTLEGIEFGFVTKVLGNRQFHVETRKGKGQSSLAIISSKMARVSLRNVVLLNIREYESRSKSDKAIYDIKAVLQRKDVSQLVKMGQIPEWMLGVESNEEDIFDIEHVDEDDVNIDDI